MARAEFDPHKRDRLAAIRSENQMTHDDTKRLASGQTGLSESAKSNITRSAATGIGAQVGSAQAQNAQQSMGMGNQFAGHAAKAQADLAKAGAQGVAQARAGADDLSNRLDIAERQEILGRMARASDVKREFNQQLLGLAGAAAGTMAGGPAGAAAGSTATQTAGQGLGTAARALYQYFL